MVKTRDFTVIIEKDEDGVYVGNVPSIKGCHTQGNTIEELMENIKEAIEVCLEAEGEVPKDSFVGIRKVQVKV